jgi:ADP-heptose:LPS heptosyltransferase
MQKIQEKQPSANCLKGVNRVAVFRALQLGDLLCAVPALRALRTALPESRITLVGLPWAQEFVHRYHKYVDEFLEFPGFPGLPEREVDRDGFPRFIGAAQLAKFDLAIQMHGSGAIVNTLMALLGAKENAGYFATGDYCPNPQTFIPYPDQGNEVRRHLRLVNHLGAPYCGEELEFPLSHHDFKELANLPGANCLVPGEYVCIHPGARFFTRRWPAEDFAVTADSLAAQGWQVVITGSASERPLAESVAALMKSSVLNLAGETTFGSAAALVAGARLVITNDTGMSHLAAAVRTPSVVVVLSSNAEQWAPLDRQRHRVVLSSVSCRPCEHRICPIGFPCAHQIKPDIVLSAVDQLLTSHPSQTSMTYKVAPMKLSLPESAFEIGAEVGGEQLLAGEAS